MAEATTSSVMENPPERIKVSFKDAVIILTPYVWSRLKEQLLAVLPVVFALVLFQLLVLQKSILDSLNVGLGIMFVIVGLMFYMEGLKLGLMPLGESIGNTLPKKSRLPVILLFALILGMGVTFAEPAIGILQQLGSSIDQTKAPLLCKLLSDWTWWLKLAVALGVGISVILGVLRLLYNWKFWYVMLPSAIIALTVCIIAYMNPNTAAILGLAWDCGGVTTGPVTVPLVLALGLGVAAITGRSDSGMAGFGIVALASMLPVITVAGLGLIIIGGHFDFHTINSTLQGLSTSSWGDTTVSAVVCSLQAIVPLVLFLYVVQVLFLKEKIANRNEVFFGIGIAIVGMIIFNMGLGAGLTSLGMQLGETLVPQSIDIYGGVLSKIVICAFAFVVGYGATLAEPALNAVGNTVEQITVGAFKKILLMHGVAFGVGLGMVVGVIKIMYNIPIMYLLVPIYVLLLVLTLFSTEEFANIGWDSGGVTTGPVTVPLVIAMGLGIAKSPQLAVVEGFGILAMASAFPILTMVTLGLVVNRKTKKIS